MGKERLELVLCDAHAQLVGRVDAEDDPADLLVVVLPEVAVAALPRHVEDREGEAVPCKLLHREAHGRHDVAGCGLRAAGVGLSHLSAGGQAEQAAPLWASGS